MLESVIIPVLGLLVFFQQGIGGENVRNALGYIGESVVLKSDAVPSWHLRTIRWSIYDNLTYIAIKKNVDLFPSFIGRLELNETSGDLIIKNVLSSDALKYRVDLVGQEATQRKTSYVQLSVEEQLSKPRIQLQHMFLDSGYCVILLSCLSMNNKLSLSWKSEPDFNESFWSGSHEDSRELVLWTSFTPNRVVTFSCSVTDGNREESCHKSVTCTEPDPRGNNTQLERIQNHVRLNERVITGFIAGIIAAIFGGICGCVFQKYKYGNKRKNKIDTDNTVVVLSQRLSNSTVQKYKESEVGKWSC